MGTDEYDESKFVLLGMATTVRTWAANLSFPMEFTNIAPYKTWIERN